MPATWPPPVNQRQLDVVRSGHLTAEALPTRDREDLISEGWERGMTDVEVAVWLQLSTYTAWRIRDRLGLPVRPVTTDEATG